MLLPCKSRAEDEPRQDLANYEAQVEASELTLQGDGTSSPGSTIEKEIDQHCDVDHPLVLSEFEIIGRVRARPTGTTPMILTFGPHDLDNPRNWSKARKWYITCFVSMLNVLT